MIKSLRQARITDGLPRVLARQEWVIALSEALGLALGKTLDYTDESQIYTRLDTARRRCWMYWPWTGRSTGTTPN